jgi:hypothetical protein
MYSPPPSLSWGSATGKSLLPYSPLPSLSGGSNIDSPSLDLAHGTPPDRDVGGKYWNKDLLHSHQTAGMAAGSTFWSKDLPVALFLDKDSCKEYFYPAVKT